MKKIVLYIDSMNRGGAQRVMINLATYLANDGIKTILVTDFPSDGRNSQYNVPDQIERRYLSNSSHGNIIYKNLVRIKRLRKIVKNELPDVVLSFLGRPNITMLLATNGLQVRKVISVRNDPNREYGGSRIKQKMIGSFFKKTDGVVFQTRDAEKYFPKAVQLKSTIILNPVDEKFFLIDRCSLTQNIISVGRIEKQKNHKLLINAFSKVKDIIPNQNLLILGDGSLRCELENYVKKINLSGRVIFKGNVHNVEDELKKASLFVLSSDWEGLPNVLMEAMAVGVPVISTDCPCGGPKMLIRSEDEGLIVPCGNECELASAILKIISSKDIQNRMSKKEKERAMEFYPKKIYSQWVDFLFKNKS